MGAEFASLESVGTPVRALSENLHCFQSRPHRIHPKSDKSSSNMALTIMSRPTTQSMGFSASPGPSESSTVSLSSSNTSSKSLPSLTSFSAIFSLSQKFGNFARGAHLARQLTNQRLWVGLPHCHSMKAKMLAYLYMNFPIGLRYANSRDISRNDELRLESYSG